MNPYGFVRFDDSRPPERISPQWHDRFQGQAGVIHCRLTAETPIFIADQTRPVLENTPKGIHKKLPFFTVANQCVIPGSSLKGVIRSVAEAAANSCMVLFDGRYKDTTLTPPEISYEKLVPHAFQPCRNNKSLCVTCRLFGMLEKHESESMVYLGNVSISDAVAERVERLEEMTLAPLQNPKPRHKAFYAPGDVFAGRKFYYHSQPIRTDLNKTRFNTTVQPVKGVFTFTVTYQNLSSEELGLLVFSLLLEPGMRHKIGLGKPLGLGSVRIEITGAELIDYGQRYRNLGKGIRCLEGEELNAFIVERIHAYISDKDSINLQDLRRIWAWPPGNDVRYPGQQWFKDNPQVRIEETP